MPRSISRRKLVQKLHKFGFNGPFPGGRHLYVVKHDLKIRVPNPHQGDISKSLVIKIIGQVGISPEEWDKIK